MMDGWGLDGIRVGAAWLFDVRCVLPPPLLALASAVSLCHVYLYSPFMGGNRDALGASQV